ncbi:hypothetical protein [Corynebacterium pilosum]|uniref:Mycothiol-dependent maleylpyruvate isomerase metal-binding domain-containing protein n=1 Tax=Corynebacterium pilosum TaxID=35756 RepID=A0A376CPN4_9CORY|nr:hypothetical protein [Corynebacterium pilosum]STC70404.1 Uncharacterised protein [Corynebacterium pilosum]
MDSRSWLNAATGGLIEILPAVHEHLDEPAIGDWSVRALLGHTSRAYLLIEHFLDEANGMTGLPKLKSAGGTIVQPGTWPPTRSSTLSVGLVPERSLATSP